MRIGKGYLRNIVFGCFIVFVLLYMIGPVIIALGISLTTTEYATFPPVGLTLRWYAEFINTSYLVNAFYLSLITASITATLCLAVGIPTSYALVRSSFKGKDVLNTLLMGPIFLPSLIIGISLFEVFVVIGLIRLSTILALILGHLVVILPYSVRMLSASMVGIDPSLERAAVNLGASQLHMFRKIILPLIKPAAFTSFLFTFVLSFDNLPVSMFITTGRENTFPVALMIAIRWSQNPSIAASAIVFVAFATILVLLFDRLVGLEFVIGV